jgi:DNA-binding beta-propeller fold protein YncE
LYCRDLTKGLDGDFDTKIELTLSEKNPLVGMPGSIVLLNGFAYIGSGTAPVVYKVDLSQKKVVNGADAPIWIISNAEATAGMIKLFTDGTTIYALNFNSDQIFAIDPAAGDKVKPLGTLGDDPEKMEGPMAGVSVQGGKHQVYVVMNMADTLWGVTTNPFAAEKVTATGAAPNAIAAHDGILYIANSMDNNISSFDVSTEKARPFASLDTGADPWDLTVVKAGDKTMVFVTAYMGKAVYVFDAATGKEIGRVEDKN